MIVSSTFNVKLQWNKFDAHGNLINKGKFLFEKTANKIDAIQASVSLIDSSAANPKRLFGTVKGDHLIVHLPNDRKVPFSDLPDEQQQKIASNLNQAKLSFSYNPDTDANNYRIEKINIYRN